MGTRARCYPLYGPPGVCMEQKSWSKFLPWLGFEPRIFHLAVQHATARPLRPPNMTQVAEAWLRTWHALFLCSEKGYFWSKVTPWMTCNHLIQQIDYWHNATWESAYLYKWPDGTELMYTIMVIEWRRVWSLVVATSRSNPVTWISGCTMSDFSRKTKLKDYETDREERQNSSWQ